MKLFRHLSSRSSPGQTASRTARSRYLDIAIPIVGLVLAATAIPVELRAPDVGYIDLTVERRDVLLNLLAFAPLRFAFPRWRGIWFLLFAAGLSAAVESVQVFAASRFPAPADLASNVAGALLGMVIADSWIRPMPRLRFGRAMSGIAILLTGVIIAVAASPGKPSTLSNWDLGAGLAVGDELTGGRPWRGDIQELAIAAGVVDGAAAASPVFGPVHHPPLSPRSLLDRGSADSFYRRILAKGSFTVVVRLQTASVTQTGPARIVTCSRDPFSRNFTLGQEQDSLVFRVRTPVTGLNGMWPELQSAPVLQPDQPRLVVASYDGVISRISVDGKLAGRLNVKAAGRMFPELADVHVPLLSYLVGLLAAIALLGVRDARNHPVVSCAAVGAAAGLLFVAAGGSSCLPGYVPVTVLLALAGGGAVGVSVRHDGQN